MKANILFLKTITIGGVEYIMLVNGVPVQINESEYKQIFKTFTPRDKKGRFIKR